MSQPKIAVIVPVYNAENFLKRCLESILNQENFKEIKVICINDASKDSSKLILEEYERIKAHRPERSYNVRHIRNSKNCACENVVNSRHRRK